MNVTKEIMAYTEVLNALNYMESKYVEKIPKELINFFKKNSLKYSMCFDENGELKISPLAEEILCYINLEYWSDSEERKKLIDIYKKNDEKLSEIYDIKKVLDKRHKKSNNENNVTIETKQLIEVKENLFQKLINKIKRLFKM